MLQRMKYDFTANTIAIQSISKRVDALANDQHLAMYPSYDDYCRTHRILEEVPHPSGIQTIPSTMFQGPVVHRTCRMMILMIEAHVLSPFP